MVPQPIKIRADFKLTCYKFDGVDAIRGALQDGEKVSTEEVPIHFRVIGPPIYECSTVTKNKTAGIKLMGQALKEVNKSISLRDGSFLLQTMPTVIGESSGKGIKDQLKTAMERDSGIEEEGEEEENQEGITFNVENTTYDDDTRMTAHHKRADSNDN